MSSFRTDCSAKKKKKTFTRVGRTRFASASRKSFAQLCRYARLTLRVSFTRKLRLGRSFISAGVFWLSVKVKCYLICGRRREEEPGASVISEPPLPQYILPWWLNACDRVRKPRLCNAKPRNGRNCTVSTVLQIVKNISLTQTAMSFRSTGAAKSFAYLRNGSLSCLNRTWTISRRMNLR